MSECLRCRESLFGIIRKQVLNQINAIARCVGQQFVDACARLRWEIELHVRSMFLESFENLWLGCTKNLFRII